MPPPLSIPAVDYHTAGEPFRIVTEGFGPLKGETVLAKRRWAREHIDDIRKLLVYEPRGHADMYGGFVTEPSDDGADLGVVFFHNAGYSTACGHGTIALVTWALDSGRISAVEPETKVTVDVPSGRLETTARVEGDRVVSVRFRNVPSFVFAEDLKVPTSRGEVVADISYGGAFYASVPAAALGLRVDAGDLPELIALGREIKHLLEADTEVAHPFEPDIRTVYGVIFYEDADGPSETLAQRNVAIFADGEVDRSPCGSGTSARLAILDKRGHLERSRQLVHYSIVDSMFTGSVTGDAKVGDYDAVVTEIEGQAHLTGHHTFELDPHDPIGTGFLLR